MPRRTEPLSVRLARLQPGQPLVLTRERFAADFSAYRSLKEQLKAAVTLAEAAGCMVEFLGREDAFIAISRDEFELHARRTLN